MSNIKRLNSLQLELTHEGTVHLLTIADRAFSKHAGLRAALMTGTMRNSGDSCCQLILIPTASADALIAHADELMAELSDLGIVKTSFQIGTVDEGGYVLHGEDGSDYAISDPSQAQVWADSDENNEVTAINILAPNVPQITMPRLDPISLPKLKNAAVLLVELPGHGTSPHSVFDLGQDINDEHELYPLYDMSMDHFVGMMNSSTPDEPWRYAMVTVEKVEDQGQDLLITMSHHGGRGGVKFAVPKVN